MTRNRPPRRSAQGTADPAASRSGPVSSAATPKGTSPQSRGGQAESRAGREPRSGSTGATGATGATGVDRFAGARAVIRQDRFKAAVLFAVFGLFLLLVSQSLPHDYGFTELGALFTFSVYDLVLAMLGLAVGLAMMARRRQMAVTVGLFAGVLVLMLLGFDALFPWLRDGPLGELLYLVAPVAVALMGASLWLAPDWRDRLLVPAAMVLAFSFSLFVGLDDFGTGVPAFATAAALSALWIILAPAFLLRCFQGPWLTIPARILGSWLLVIAIIVTVSLYAPLPFSGRPPLDLSNPAVPPPDLSIDGEDNGMTPLPGMEAPDEAPGSEPGSGPGGRPAPSPLDGLKTPHLGG